MCTSNKNVSTYICIVDHSMPAYL